MDEINQIIQANKHLAYKEIAEIAEAKTGIKCNREMIRARFRRMRKRGEYPKTHTNVGSALADIQINRLKEIAYRTEQKYQEAITELLKYQDIKEKWESTNGQIKDITIVPKKSSKINQAVAVAIASDWHIEERVVPEQVSGLNEYNLRIAKQRAQNFFTNLVKLVKKEQQQVEIDTLILALLGDFITGQIHEELTETNQLMPNSAVIEAKSWIIAGIEYILKHTKLKLIIPCHSGNHARTTHKQRISSEAEHSLEYMMYLQIQDYFRNNKRISFVIHTGYHSYINVFSYTLRFHHGHAVKFGGGVGGITIPIKKALSQWNKYKFAHYDFQGHFHQYMPVGDFNVNGSLIGYNAYALNIKADFEKPQQSFFLIDKDYGMTIRTPIIV